MRALLVIAAATAVGSCTAPASPPASDLARVTAGRVAGPPQTCVSLEGVSNVRALDSQTLAYGSGRTVYINHLGSPCPGVEPLGLLIVEANGNQYCRGDRIRGRELGATISGPRCVLSDWVPYRTP